MDVGFFSMNTDFGFRVDGMAVLFGTGTNTTGDEKATLDMLDRRAPAIAAVR